MIPEEQKCHEIGFILELRFKIIAQLQGPEIPVAFVTGSNENVISNKCLDLLQEFPRSTVVL
jgi:hypothetical protein